MVATTNAIAKIAAVVAGLGLVASSFASFAVPAKAATADELQAQVNALLAQIAAMQGGSSSSSMTFTMDLTLGSKGAEVTALQNWLIKQGQSIPAGATGFFGAQTQAALAAWQKANGVMPAAGYFGPITRAKVNAMAGGSMSGGNTGGTTTVGLSGGEASFGSIEGRSGEEDSVDEGDSAEVAVFEFDVDDADARVDRLDLGFMHVSGTGEDQPWDAFDSVTIENAKGKELASVDVSDEKDWLEDNPASGQPYIFRFTKLNDVVKEGDTAELHVIVEAANGAVGSGSDTWQLKVAADGVRGVDGAGIDQYTTGSDTQNFDIDEKGSDDELKVRSSTDDPNSSTLQVEDSKTSDWYTVFVFDLEADKDGGDIELKNLPINFTTSDSDLSTVVDDVKVSIDGEEFNDFDWTGGNTDTSASTTFDIDRDFTVKSGERVPVEVMVKFKALTGNYSAGTTIAASTTSQFITAEGDDNLTAGNGGVTGSAAGDTHTLRSSGINVTPKSDSAVATVVDGSDNDYGTFTIVVDVTAFDDDQYISQTAGTAYTFQIENASDGSILGSSTATSSTISSTAETEGGSYRINDGDTETFTFTMTLNPNPAYEGISYRAQLLTIVSGTTAASPTGNTFTASPASDYETNGVLIND